MRTQSRILMFLINPSPLRPAGSPGGISHVPGWPPRPARCLAARRSLVSDAALDRRQRWTGHTCPLRSAARAMEGGAVLAARGSRRLGGKPWSRDLPGPHEYHERRGPIRRDPGSGHVRAGGAGGGILKPRTSARRSGTLARAGRRWILLTLLVPFTILTHLAVRSGSPGDVRERPVLLPTLATITGPFTGAFARNGQSCCLDSSLRLAVLRAGPRARHPRPARARAVRARAGGHAACRLDGGLARLAARRPGLPPPRPELNGSRPGTNPVRWSTTEHAEVSLRSRGHPPQTEAEP